MQIPSAGPHVNTTDLHPELQERVRRLIANSAFPLQVRSGARTYAHQKQLYRQYQNRGYAPPVVANPDKVWSNGRQGSGHMVQPAGAYQHGNLPNDGNWAYAVDMMFKVGYPTPAQQTQFHQEARNHGLYPNVPGEWWHLVPTKEDELVAPYPDEPPAMAEITQREWSRFKKQSNQNRARINRLEASMARVLKKLFG